MPIEKIVIEIIFGVILQALGSSFWSCAKYLRFRERLLMTYDTLKTTVSSDDKKTIEQESKNLQLAGRSYGDTMQSTLEQGKQAQVKRMALLSLPTIAILAGSYFLGSLFLTINLSFFFILAVFPLKAAIRTAVFGELLKLSLIVYRWNKENADACKKFCTEERPVFQNLHKVITEL